MIRVPVTLMVAQWALLGGLSILVLLFYRQLAYLTHVRRGEAERPAEAQVGDVFPSQISVRPFVDGKFGAFRALTPDADSPLMLLFADPQCFACTARVQELGVLAETGELDARVTILTDASADELRRSAAFATSHLPIANFSEDLIRRFGIEGTPYLVALSADGHVLTRGVAESQEMLIEANRALGTPGEDLNPAFAVLHHETSDKKATAS